MENLLTSFQGESPFLQAVGRWAYLTWHERDMAQVYLHLILSALFPIYIGAHASLRRPPSAASPKKSPNEEDEEEDEGTEVEPMLEGLQPSDAILFPVLACVTLGGLYLIIKWLNDPAILNKILGWYFSILGVFGVGKLAADALNVATTFVFPSVWSDGSRTYFIDSVSSSQKAGKLSSRKSVEGKLNPFPGFLSRVPFPKNMTRGLWSIRALLRDSWMFRGYIHGMVEIKSRVRLNDVIGFVIGSGVIAIYNVVGKTWWLTNLIAFGFCYGTFQLISPTTFWTGSLVLAGLFVYDIIMVFYTPMMVTVATTLDIPIKLVFPGPTRESMLGLGDVVLPGIMIALALRFDLYLHYQALQKTLPLSSPELSPYTPAPKPSTSKVSYTEAGGKWGERFWTRKFPPSIPHLKAMDEHQQTIADSARFNKIYFKAGLVGYIVGMITTLLVLVCYEHAQPALLYLVPGVLSALWGTALVRGDFKHMWAYTEDGSLDEEVEKSEEERAVGEPLEVKNKKTINKQDGLGVQGLNDHKVGDKNVDGDNEKAIEVDGDEDGHKGHYVFFFSLSAPKSKSLRLAKLLQGSEEICT